MNIVQKTITINQKYNTITYTKDIIKKILPALNKQLHTKCYITITP